MRIAGHLKTSFIDYPDKISSVFFTAGCNFRCPYCHNGDLVVGQDKVTILESTIAAFLDDKKKYLDGLVVSGGEPTIHADLPDFLSFLSAWGLPIKLDTNGSHPDMLEALVGRGLIDYVAMDVKGPLSSYSDLVMAPVDTEAIKESRRLLMEGTLPYEFRSTIVGGLHTEEDVLAMAQEIEGADHYVLQSFRDQKTVLAGPGSYQPLAKKTMEKLADQVRPLFGRVSLR